MGSNMAENYPVGFQWVAEAKERGAKIIHVDPRFTRTSAFADTFVPLRAGSDIAFLGAIVRYILEEDRAFKEYVVRYTNAATIISEDFRKHRGPRRRVLGLGSRDAHLRSRVLAVRGPAGGGGVRASAAPHRVGGPRRARRPWSRRGAPPRPEPQDPRCVYQLLRKRAARAAELVGDRGVSQAASCRVRALCELRPRAHGALCYAVGWTQHGRVQYIRTASIIQLLLGNIGRPAAGSSPCAATRRSGSTDIPTLYDILPGYLPMPAAEACAALRDYR
jgi:formate dehydrogenase major subunit